MTAGPDRAARRRARHRAPASAPRASTSLERSRSASARSPTSTCSRAARSRRCAASWARPTTSASSSDMHLADGTIWALPVTLAVAEAPRRASASRSPPRTARCSPTLDVAEVYAYDAKHEAELCFRTTEDAHPGVARLYGQPGQYLAGEVTVFERPKPAFPDLALDPEQTRAAFAERGWKRVVGFQTRNPIHRAHEYVTKSALEIVDGLLIHPLVGETKGDDVPAARAHRLLPRAARQLLPGRPHAALGVPGGHALRRPARGGLARDLPQELRLLALHRRPRPRRRRQLLRHLRRAADLRRARRRRPSASSR